MFHPFFGLGDLSERKSLVVNEKQHKYALQTYVGVLTVSLNNHK